MAQAMAKPTARMPAKPMPASQQSSAPSSEIPYRRNGRFISAANDF